MQSPEIVLGQRALPRTRADLPRLNEGGVLALASWAVYMLMGLVVTFVIGFVDPDALSRVANAYYAVYSRDPHLAAIGFVWNPLPSLMMIPFLPLKFVAPAIIDTGFIATIFSTAFMALAVYVLWSILVDFGVRRWMRLMFTVIFALHPMIVEFGGNGMTEALFILLLLLQTKFLARWIRTDDLVALVLAGGVMGVAYLVRYEAAPVGIGTGLLVGAVALLRAPGPLRQRLMAAVSDLIVYGLPLGAMFVLWAGVSWLIVGDPFEQFGSVYGTASQLAADYESIFARGVGGVANIIYTAAALLLLEPIFPIVMVAALVVGIWRRDAGLLAVLAVFGSVLGFAIFAFLTGRTGGWWRYYITIIPLTVLLAGLVVGRASSTEWGSAGWSTLLGSRRRVLPAGVMSRSPSRLPAVTAVVFAIGLVVAAPTSVGATFDAFSRFGFELRDSRIEYRQAQVYRVVAGRTVATYLDELDLADGSVLVDVFLGFPAVLSSDDPKQFVITTDRDFEAILADPSAFDVEYLLVPKPDEELASLDAINIAYPTMYADGAGIATLSKSFDSDVGYNWRLYRLDQ